MAGCSNTFRRKETVEHFVDTYNREWLAGIQTVFPSSLPCQGQCRAQALLPKVPNKNLCSENLVRYTSGE